jgi:mono/diheme cytochrome c family protein
MRIIWVCLAAAALAGAQEPASVFQNVCAKCHPPEAVVTPRSRAEWQETINKMVDMGAKVSAEERTIVLDYLSATYAPGAAGGRGGRAGRGGRGGGPTMNGAPLDRHVVDPDAANRGRTVWVAECIECHGTSARGTDKGKNLIQSDMVLHDRYGSTLVPFLAKGHPMQSGRKSTSLSQTEIADLSHFIHERVYDTLRGSPIFQPQQLVTGNAKAGEAWFNGAGKCSTCHSATGDLKGIGGRFDPATLQGRFLFPRGGGRGGRGGGGGGGGKQLTLTITPPNGPAVTGTPVVFDDFDVSVRDEKGEMHAFTRSPQLKVVRNDPFAVHDQLLDVYTDKNMHDMLAYLVTLK